MTSPSVSKDCNGHQLPREGFSKAQQQVEQKCPGPSFMVKQWKSRWTSIMCFFKQRMAWEYPEKAKGTKEWKHNLPEVLGTVSRSTAYVCSPWASMNCSATAKSSHMPVCKYRSILEATKHSCNIPTCEYCCLQRFLKSISLCFIHTYILVVHTDTLVNISGIETEKNEIWKGPLDVIYQTLLRDALKLK